MYSMQFFLKGLQATRKHKARFGQANAKCNYRAPNGLHLGRWQYDVKKRYQSGRLSPEQIDLLRELGFTFNIREHGGRIGLDKFIDYVKRHHSPDVPPGYRTASGYRLGLWQRYIR